MVQELNNFISDLCTAHEDLLAKNPVLVNQYGSSSWLKLLEPTPPPSSASSESPDSAPSDTDSSCDGEQLTDHFQLRLGLYSRRFLQEGSRHFKRGCPETGESNPAAKFHYNLAQGAPRKSHLNNGQGHHLPPQAGFHSFDPQ